MIWEKLPNFRKLWYFLTTNFQGTKPPIKSNFQRVLSLGVFGSPKHPRKNLLWSSLSNKQTCQNKKASKPRCLNSSSRKKKDVNKKHESRNNRMFPSVPFRSKNRTAGALHSSRLSRKVQLKLPWWWWNLGSSWKMDHLKRKFHEISYVFRVYVSFQGGRIHGTGIQYLDLAPRMQLWQIKGFVSRRLVVTGPLNHDLFWCRGAVFYNYWQLLRWENIPGITGEYHKSSHGFVLGWTKPHFAHTVCYMFSTCFDVCSNG